ncbi:putative non-specific polyamine oxidase [Helianthus annuus]|nr:putative non-specific polyamine oxidase [Helianthus annuus]
MVIKKPRIVIIGAGMSGLTAANKLYKSGVKKGAFELCVVEGGNRIGGRINTSEFSGDRIEMGATWIHGIGGSPVYKIAQEIKSLESEQPWEGMDGFLDDPITIAENGYVLDSSLVDPISNLFNNLMAFAQGNGNGYGNGNGNGNWNGNGSSSVGCFLKKGLESYWKVESRKEKEGVFGCGDMNKKRLEEAIFAMYEKHSKDLHSC